MTEQAYKFVGKPRKLVEGMEKVTGYIRYVADMVVPGMLYGRPILSPYAHAKILRVDKSQAEAIPGIVAVLTAEDLPSKQRQITSRNSAILAKEKVYFVGQPVVIVVGESEMAVADAVQLVLVEYEPLPVVATLEEATRVDSLTVWPNGLPKEGQDMSNLHAKTDKASELEGQTFNNVSNERHYQRGDVAAGFAEADVIVERTYHTNMIHQGYMEPHASLAVPDPLGRELTIYTSTQGHFGVRNEVAKLLSMPASRVRVVPMAVGGGFGAKYGILEPLTAATALAVKQPVRIILSRSEDFQSTTPAPAIQIELKTGAKKDGTLTALEARVFTDNGVFSFYHGGLISMGLGGYYKWPNLQIDCYEVHTHKPQIGAYRAPGMPQATFAIESNMHDMATQLGLDVLEFRLQNAIEAGDLMGNGQPWPSAGLKQCLERMKAHPVWQNKEKAPHEGIGLAVGGWPCAVGTSEAICRVDNDGTVLLQVGAIDISGVNSSFVLVAAEVLRVTPDQVVLVSDDTSGAYSPGSGGSQVTYSVVGAVEMAAQEAKKKLIQAAADKFEAAPEDIELLDGKAQVKGVPSRGIPIGEIADEARYKLNGTGPIVGEGHSAVKENAPGFVVHLAKVVIDPETGHIQPTEYVAIQDVGLAINPMMVHGQLQGGAVQGIGIGLYESMIYDQQAQLISGSFMDYCLPRAHHVPSIETILVENPSPYGPFGARGIAEPPIIPGPAALANAIKDATGVRIAELPINSQKLWRELGDY